MKNQEIGNKGQSAMEYLMNYGWAILIMSTAAIVFWQLGIFDFASTTEAGYSGFGEVNLAGFSYKASGEFECILTNDAGENITLNSVKVKIYGHEYSSSSDIDLTPGASEDCPTITTGFPGSEGDRYNVILVINFTDTETGVEHTSAGKVWGYYD